MFEILQFEIELLYQYKNVFTFQNPSDTPKENKSHYFFFWKTERPLLVSDLRVQRTSTLYQILISPLINCFGPFGLNWSCKAVPSGTRGHAA